MHSDATYRRILSAYDNAEDWLQIALILNVKPGTAKSWVRRYKCGKSSRTPGGWRYQKLTEAHVEELINWVSENPTISLRAMQLRLKMEYSKDVCLATIGNYLDGRLITLKKVYPISETANSNENREKRRE